MSDKTIKITVTRYRPEEEEEPTEQSYEIEYRDCLLYTSDAADE